MVSVLSASAWSSKDTGSEGVDERTICAVVPIDGTRGLPPAYAKRDVVARGDSGDEVDLRRDGLSAAGVLEVDRDHRHGVVVDARAYRGSQGGAVGVGGDLHRGEVRDGGEDGEVGLLVLGGGDGVGLRDVAASPHDLSDPGGDGDSREVGRGGGELLGLGLVA